MEDPESLLRDSKVQIVSAFKLFAKIPKKKKLLEVFLNFQMKFVQFIGLDFQHRTILEIFFYFFILSISIRLQNYVDEGKRVDVVLDQNMR